MSLPDYPREKTYALRVILKAVQHHIPLESPVLGGIRSSRIHEGKAAHLRRADASEDAIAFRSASAEIEMPSEQMKLITVEQLTTHVIGMARQLAEQQTRTMFERLSEAAEAVGNSVSVRELGEKEAFLEMERRIETDYDPKTGEPKSLTIVVHPSQLERLQKLAVEWEKDPEFVAERERIRAAKLEEWRAREDSRKLVD